MRLLASSLVLLAAGAAGTPVVQAEELPRPMSQPIVNGVLTSGLPSVAGILSFNPSTGEPFVSCTGTVIGCRTVLTAAHCFCPQAPCQPDFADTLVFLQHSGFYGVESVTINPSYQFGSRSDLAILRLTPELNGLAPTRINTTARPAVGSGGLIAGFGRTGGSSPWTGIKRAGLVVTSSCPAELAAGNFCWTFLSPVGPPGEDSSTCQGDSGGPLITDFGGGPRLAGVTSGGVFGDCLVPNGLWDTDVFVDRQWIQSVAGPDLNNTACGNLPPAGSPEAPILFGSGELGAGNPDDLYFFDLAAGTDVLWTTLNGEGPGRGDFDLYLRHGDPPTTAEFDCRSNFLGQFEACGVASPTPGTWHALITRSSGAGAYQFTVTNFGGQSTGGPCVQDTDTLCLLGGRFRVEVVFRPPGGTTQPATAIPFTDRAGMFWFFNENNVEMLVKMQNACVAPFNRFWFFFAATTNVEFTVRVTDTETGQTNPYSNPQGMVALPVADTQAFATCP